MEVDSQENSLVTVKQKALELIAGTGGGHINQEAIQEHMEVISKKWQRLKHLTVQRYVPTCISVCMCACTHTHTHTHTLHGSPIILVISKLCKVHM